jgi:hypothetical protein
MTVAVAVQLVVGVAMVAADELTVTRLAWIDGLGTHGVSRGLWPVCRRRVGVASSSLLSPVVAPSVGLGVEIGLVGREELGVVLGARVACE